jgi:hypothetical protein
MRGVLKHSNELGPKNLLKTPNRVELKTKQQSKKKAFGQNIDRRYQKPPRCHLISRAHLHVKHPCLKPLAKKKKPRK